ncbi:rCG63309 [Rattus norvegicus]|uniref:RCG63309 n=1 Tax=Rattus norvegicus TaxID=10116 RepID=A6JKM6_RAT|nr:rCG63309 [Rattus norvegicus]
MLIALLIASQLGTSGECSAGQARSAGPGLGGRDQCSCGCRGWEGGRRGAPWSLKEYGSILRYQRLKS